MAMFGDRSLPQSGIGRALLHRRPRRAATTPATSSGERQSLSRSARSSHWLRGSSRRERRHPGTLRDRAWARVHPSRPPIEPSQIRCHLSVQQTQSPPQSTVLIAAVHEAMSRPLHRPCDLGRHRPRPDGTKTFHPLVASAPRSPSLVSKGRCNTC